MKLLEPAEWQGNIRELRSFVEKVCLDALFEADRVSENAETVNITCDLLLNRLSSAAGQAQDDQFPHGLSAIPILRRGEKMEQYLEKIETDLLKNALAAHNYNQTRAAKELGISRSGLIKKLKRMAH